MSRNLVVRFAVTSLVVFVVVGWVLLDRLGDGVERRLVAVAEQRAVSLAQGAQSVFQILGITFPEAVDVNASEADLDPSLQLAIDALTPQIDPLEAAGFVLRDQGDGSIILVTDEALAARPSELAAAGNRTASVVDAELGSLRTQVALTVGTNDAYIMEVAQDFAPIAAAAAAERRRSAIILVLGLLVLYASLLPLLRGATQRLNKQADYLQDLLTREQATSSQLRIVDDMKNAFLTAVSHELRTPLTVVRGGAGTLRGRFDELSEGDRRRLVTMVDDHSARLEKLVQDLVDVDRLTAGHVRARRREIDLVGCVRRAVEETPTPGRPVRVPSGTVPARVDPTMVERIVSNLVRNAVKYTPDGGLIETTVEAVDGGWLIVVDDEGAGIPMDEREKVFEPLHRLHDDHAAPGTGVGLTLVARFSAAHDGWADVIDAPSGGARFRVYLAAPKVGRRAPRFGKQSDADAKNL